MRIAKNSDAQHEQGVTPPGRGGLSSRRGTITLWTILFIPVLTLLFLVVIQGIHLWLARVELENALEAAALAAVREWAETGGAPAQDWTQQARDIGLEYAAANTIHFTPVTAALFDIEDNLGTNTATNPNENATCDIDGIAPPTDREGTLIFGAITNDDPLADCSNLEFDTREVPGCGGAAIILGDVSSSNLSHDTDHAFGFSYPATARSIAAGLTITSITIDLDPIGESPLYFDLDNPPRLSDNSPQPAVEGTGPGNTDSNQHDNYGFVGWANTTSPTSPELTPPDGVWPTPPYSSPQITFPPPPPPPGTSTTLTINFSAFGTDAGFEPGDRFRFGADVLDSGSTASGDDLGTHGAEITVTYSDGSTLRTTYQDTDDGNNQTDCTSNSNPGWWVQDALGNWHFVTHPSRDGPHTGDSSPWTGSPVDIPCPESYGSVNHQSIAGEGSQGGGMNYAVRAQATIEVPLLCGTWLCGLGVGPFRVQACSTAMWDCESQRPMLIHVDTFTCEVP